MKVSDTISGGFFILFAGLIFYFTKDLRMMPGQNYGASFFPRMIATGMGLMGLVMVVQDLRDPESPRGVQIPDWFRSPRHIANFLLVIGVLVFYILISDWLGFLITGFICLYTMLIWLHGAKYWRGSLALSVAFIIGLQFFFGQFLRVPLPWGLLQDYAW